MFADHVDVLGPPAHLVPIAPQLVPLLGPLRRRLQDLDDLPKLNLGEPGLADLDLGQPRLVDLPDLARQLRPGQLALRAQLSDLPSEPAPTQRGAHVLAHPYILPGLNHSPWPPRPIPDRSSQPFTRSRFSTRRKLVLGHVLLRCGNRASLADEHGDLEEGA